jgi:hypothetical protein
MVQCARLDALLSDDDSNALTSQLQIGPAFAALKSAILGRKGFDPLRIISAICSG